MLVPRLVRNYTTSKHCHPHLFKQYLQLTDGSYTVTTSCSPIRPMAKLNMDSLMHASWNPIKAAQLRGQGVQGGQVSKFKDRFGDIDAIEDLITGSPLKDAVSLKPNKPASKKVEKVASKKKK